MKRLARNVIIIVLCGAVLAATFAAGVAVAPSLTRTVTPTPGVGRAPTSARTEQDMAVLTEAWRVIERDYFGETPATKSLAQGAIQGLVDALDDPYSAYQTDEEMASYQSEVDGSIQSIGMSVEKRDGALLVVAPLASSPAQKAGLLPGDMIVRIEDKDAASLTLGQAISLLRGPDGSIVTVIVLRKNADLLTFRVERGPVTAPLLTSRMLEDRIGYVQIAFFDGSVGRELRTALQQIEDAGARGLIIDLRNNPGGYLDTAIEVAGLIIPEGVIVSQQGRTGTYTWSYADQGRILVVDGPEGKQSSPVRNSRVYLADAPIVVLTNGGTASAAEVLAAALQDYGRAILIGQRTYGKGAVTGDYALSDGSSIHMTNGQWLSPKGRSVSGRGLSPDIAVDSDGDGALERAVQYLLTKR